MLCRLIKLRDNGPIRHRFFKARQLYLLLPCFLWVIACRNRAAIRPDPVPVGWVDWHNPDRVDGLGRACAGAANFNVVSILRDELKIVTDRGGNAMAEPDQSNWLPFAFKPSDTPGVRRVLRTDKGWLVGFDGGELGGSLWFLSQDGKRSTQLLDVDILKIFEALGRVYVFTSDAAEASDTGSIYEIGSDGAIERTVHLAGRPFAMFQDARDSFLMVGDQGIYRVNIDLKMETVLRRDLQGFFPNSIAVARDRTIYIGLRFFVLRLIPAEKSLDQQWLVRSQCKYFHVADDRSECVCDGN
jgi:hypothetical protein